MSYVTQGGKSRQEVGSMLSKGQDFVPLWGIAARTLAKDSVSKLQMAGASLAVVTGLLVIGLALVGFPVAVAEYHKKKPAGMTTQWLGARHPSEIRLSDSSMMGSTSGRRDKSDTFIGSGVGPEFVEQPNYILGNEDMMRTALSKYNRLKASGAQVSDWKTYWTAYVANNADDLTAALYDTGDMSDASAVSGFDSKKLRTSTIGR